MQKTVGFSPTVFVLLTFVVFFCRTWGATAFGATGLAHVAIGATNASFSLLFLLVKIESGKTDDQGDDKDRQIIKKRHTLATSRGLDAFFASSRFRLRIRSTTSTASARTIPQPRMGIHALPKCAPLKSVPKKYTRNPSV